MEAFRKKVALVSAAAHPPTHPHAYAPVLTLIAAVARNGTIGRDNTLPWRIPEDLQRFKALTLGHPVIMGRKTWDSLGRPLPGRLNMVISRDPAYLATGATTVTSLHQAIAQATAQAPKEIFIMGGAEIYQLALPLAQRLQLTEIEADVDGDAHFPPFDRTNWRETLREARQTGDGLCYAFVTYERQCVLPV